MKIKSSASFRAEMTRRVTQHIDKKEFPSEGTGTP